MSINTIYIKPSKKFQTQLKSQNRNLWRLKKYGLKEARWEDMEGIWAVLGRLLG